MAVSRQARALDATANRQTLRRGAHWLGRGVLSREVTVVGATLQQNQLINVEIGKRHLRGLRLRHWFGPIRSGRQTSQKVERSCRFISFGCLDTGSIEDEVCSKKYGPTSRTCYRAKVCDGGVNDSRVTGVRFKGLRMLLNTDSDLKVSAIQGTLWLHAAEECGRAQIRSSRCAKNVVRIGLPMLMGPGQLQSANSPALAPATCDW
jgi:hypothetical protein